MLEFRRVLTSVLGTIKCGHTRFSGESDADIVSFVEREHLFPLQLWFQSGRAYVLLNLSADPRVEPGWEVESINGMSMASILARILPNISGDGDTQGGKFEYLRHSFHLMYRIYIGQADRFHLRLQNPQDRKIMDLTIPGAFEYEFGSNRARNPANRNLPALVSRLDRTTPNTELEYPPSRSVAVLTIHTFSGKEFPNFLSQAFADLRARSIQNLVIDLRRNTGGKDELGMLLYSYLSDSDFRFYDHILMKTLDPSFSHSGAADLGNC